VAFYFGRILTRLGVAYFNFFGCFNFFPVILLFVKSHQAEIIVVKRLIQELNNSMRREWELNLDHAIVITRSPFRPRCRLLKSCYLLSQLYVQVNGSAFPI